MKLLLYAFGLLALTCRVAVAVVEVTDDTGNPVRLTAPAARIVSTAPSATELLFAAGAGARVVAVDLASDHPPAVTGLPRIGTLGALDVERIALLAPDLVVAWGSGARGADLDRLRALGVAVYVTEPRRLADIPRTLRALGRLADTVAEAEVAARAFESRIEALRAAHASVRPLRVFYQIWDRPLMTLGGPHILTEVIALCGGRNLFADVERLALSVSTEAVLARRPEVILTSGLGAERPAWLADWESWPELPAVAKGHLYSLPADLLQRAGPRLAEGAARLCARLDAARGE